MDNEKAAKELGISIRSLQRATKAGKVKVAYQRGKSGKMEAVYDESEIARYKEELNEVVEREPQFESTNIALTRRDMNQAQIVAAIAEAFVKALNVRTLEAPNHKRLVDIDKQLALSVSDAAELAGLSKNFLLNAIHARKLKARIIGRGYKIKRADLDSYMKKL
jgi:excisionase family DNA binding protein